MKNTRPFTSADYNRIVSIGYNGFLNGCSDEDFPWSREGEFLETKYPYVVHAEPNAILNCTSSLKGATLYVTLFPCNECAKLIIQSGIKEVVFLSDKYASSENNIAASASVAAVGAARRNVFFSVEGYGAVAAVSCLDIYFYIIYKGKVLLKQKIYFK